MAIIKNTSGQRLPVYAVDANGAAVTGDAANITAYISKDGGTPVATNDTNPTELDATNTPGLYIFSLSKSETNCDLLVLTPTSVTSGVILSPLIIYTEPSTASTNAGYSASGSYSGSGATLAQLRSRLADITGRRGLNTDIALCDRVLNQACRHAESLQETPQSVRRYFFKPAADATTTNLEGLRAVHHIWVSNGVDKGELAYIDYNDARAEGLLGVDELIGAGSPESYTIYPAGLAIDQEAYTNDNTFEDDELDSAAYADIQFSLSYSNLALLWLPATDGTWTFDLEGKWWPRTLSNSSITNWWTVNQPDTIVYFAAMFLALERGNPELAEHWRKSAQLGLETVDRTMIESGLAIYTSAPGNMFIRG